ncbi:MAG: alanine dehydrogenase [Dehalococcoidia bacterium]|nr:alanine dehydrogenase [Dehalococcoidia bacterium]
MRLGCVREQKAGEERVALAPDGAAALVGRGHEVVIEAGAGRGSGFQDDAYAAAGASVEPDAAAIWRASDLLVKVKEPLPTEYALLNDHTALFGYLHLAADRPLTERLLEAGTVALAPELIRGRAGGFPLLAPMSQIAGRMAADIAAQLLKRPGPGRGMLLGGIAGVPSANAVIIGSGTVGTSAARALVGLDARVTMVSDDLPRLRQIVEEFNGRVETRVASPASLAEALAGADLAILAVYVPGTHTPAVVTREMLRSMADGSVLVDVSIDQGGAAETSRPTSHEAPTFVEEGVVHYCVPNMPGAVPRTSTLALTSASLPYILALADLGVDGALAADPGLAEALSTYRGKLVHGPVAREFGMPLSPNPFLAEGQAHPG